MKTTLMALTWNEIEGARVILPQIRRDWIDQILVVDGGSTDGTIEFARAQGCEVYVQKQRGIRKAYEEAWPLIRGDIVITFSPEGNSVVERIPALIDKMREGYDMVIVSRYREGARSEDDDWVTAFGNRMFTGLINFCFQGPYTDAMVMYRAYRTQLAHELGLFDDAAYQPMEKLFCTVAGVEPLLSIRAAKRRCHIGEIPGDEPKRIGGNRKLQVIRWGATYLGQIVKETFTP
jgi:glycosyltransferase involved in cell wall biosynthesis